MSEERKQKNQFETGTSPEESRLPAWLSMDLKEWMKISIFVMARDLAMVLVEKYRKKHPYKVRMLSSKSYGIRLVTISVIIFALVMIKSGLENVAFSYLFPPTYFYQSWIESGYNITSYFASTAISLGFTSLLLLVIRNLILCRNDYNYRIYHVLNWFVNMGIANLCSTLCGNAVMYYFDHIDQFSTFFMAVVFVGGTVLSAIAIMFQLEECFQVVTYLILSNLYCPLYFRFFSALIKTKSDYIIIVEMLLLMLSFYGITLIAEKGKAVLVIGKILHQLTSARGLLMLPAFMLIGYSIRFYYLGKTLGAIMVLLMIALIWGTVVFLLCYKADDFMDCIMKSQKGKAILLGVLSILSALCCLGDIRKGGIYVVSVIVYALISIITGVIAVKMWRK